MTAAPSPEDDYRARLYSDNIAVFEAMIVGIERIHNVAPEYSAKIGKKLAQQLDDLRSSSKTINARVIKTFDERKHEAERRLALDEKRLQLEAEEAKRTHAQRWYILALSSVIVVAGDALAIWIFSSADGALNTASAALVGGLATGGGGLALIRAIALEKSDKSKSS